MNYQKLEDFGSYRRIFFPIYRHEFIHFFPLLSLFSFIAFDYHLLRSLKDIFFINYTGGAGVLPFIKTYVVTPAMLLLVYGYVKISERLSVYMRFNFVIAYFLVVIGACYLFFIPNLDTFRLDKLADNLYYYMPGMDHLWDTIRLWPLSILYIHADVWSSLMFGIAFWSLANQITSFGAAERMYSYITSLGSAIGAIAAGMVLKEASFIVTDFNNGLLVVLWSIVVMIIMYNVMARIMRRSTTLPKTTTAENFRKPKYSLSLYDSIKAFVASKHLALIAMVVMSFNVFINLFEAIWKDQIACYVKFCGKEALTDIYGDQSMYIGVLVLAFGFLAPFIKNRGWKTMAIVTPKIALVATCVFCLFMFGNESLLGKFKLFNNDKVMGIKLSVIFGLINLIFIQSSKYVLYDSTKEQAYIPLSDDEKIKGKAAIDGLGSRLGKSLGGLILSFPVIGLIHVFGSISNAKFYICIIIFAVLFLWITAVKKLDVSIKNRLQNNTDR